METKIRLENLLTSFNNLFFLGLLDFLRLFFFTG
jgi:hypothetical protein